MKRNERIALTLIEVMLAIAIMGVLIALLLPAIQAAREAANRTACSNNLKQIGIAFLSHYQTYGYFPDGGYGWWTARSTNSNGQPLVSPRQNWGWAYQILPYIEQGNAFRADPATAASAVSPIYFCPSRRSPVALPGIQNGLPNGSLRGAIDHAGCGGFGPNGISSNDFVHGLPNNGLVVSRLFAPIRYTDVPDGASNTLLVGERNFNWNLFNQSWQWDENDGYIDGWDWDVIRWGNQPPVRDRRDDSFYSFQFGSSHPVGCLFVLGDASVHLVHYGVSPAMFRAACGRNDNQVVSPDDF